FHGHGGASETPVRAPSHGDRRAGLGGEPLPARARCRRHKTFARLFLSLTPNRRGPFVRQDAPETDTATASPCERLAALGITLPPPPAPVANFETHVLDGRTLYLSGQGPIEANGRLHTGRVGEAYDTD